MRSSRSGKCNRFAFAIRPRAFLFKHRWIEKPNVISALAAMLAYVRNYPILNTHSRISLGPSGLLRGNPYELPPNELYAISSARDTACSRSACRKAEKMNINTHAWWHSPPSPRCNSICELSPEATPIFAGSSRMRGRLRDRPRATRGRSCLSIRAAEARER